MLFFERILNSKPGGNKEQRRATRYAVGSSFPMKTMLNLLGRDEFGQQLASADGRGWNWTGRLVNFSESGVSIQLPPAVIAKKGDTCLLILSLAGHQLNIPCHVMHMRPHSDSVQFGLKFDFPDKNTPAGFQQLVELVAFGASLKPEKPQSSLDASGYLVEYYEGDFDSRLTVWRSKSGGPVLWFEFHLAGYCVRGDTGARTLEFATGEGKNAKPVTPAQVGEIHQLFKWVVPNIARAVPSDIRQSLQSFAA